MNEQMLAEVIDVWCNEAQVASMHQCFAEGVPDEGEEYPTSPDAQAALERNRRLRDAFAQLLEARVQPTDSGVRIALLTGETFEISGRQVRPNPASHVASTLGGDQRKGQAVAAAIEALYHARHQLLNIAEEDDKAGRHQGRWNKGGEGYNLIEEVDAAASETLEALRDELRSRGAERKGTSMGRQQA